MNCPICGIYLETPKRACPHCGNNLVPEAARADGAAFASSDLVGTGTMLTSEEHGGVVEQWEAQPDLRWKRNYDDRRDYMGGMTRYGELAPSLQQLWRERLNGGMEWRDVPLVDSGVPTDQDQRSAGKERES